MPAMTTIKPEQKHAPEDTCPGNCRGQNPKLRTAVQYLLAGLLLHFLVALAPENDARTWNLGFSWSVKSQGIYLTFSNPKYFQPHKALVYFQPFGTDPVFHFALWHYSTQSDPPHTPLDLTTGLVKHPHDTLHFKRCALLQQGNPKMPKYFQVCILLNTS